MSRISSRVSLPELFQKNRTAKNSDLDELESLIWPFIIREWISLTSSKSSIQLRLHPKHQHRVLRPHPGKIKLPADFATFGHHVKKLSWFWQSTARSYEITFSINYAEICFARNLNRRIIVDFWCCNYADIFYWMGAWSHLFLWQFFYSMPCHDMF